MTRIRVLLIEDNRLLREGITAMLNEQPDIKAVATTGNGDALTKARKLKPQVVLLDTGLRSQNSVRVVHSIKTELPETQVIVMDLIPVQVDVVTFVKAGVSGFILKDASLDDFLHTIREVATGKKVLPPPLAGSLFSQIVEHAIQHGNPDQLLRAVRLTKREREVMDQIAGGKSNKEIAAKLHIAVHTVKSHVHNILEKLALHTRLELASFAHRERLTEIPADRPPAESAGPIHPKD
ncbi:MAG: response regulator transcription factor [Candidatus Eisenbacteria bacterium]|uniref:Response regulator transcription factor n=1 Tax=Eiseniibacteriota bacterium TaxID=2212470 RepID=A0A948W7R7_UNCEI|nr:response regulator transcription factor [Candidatus Eisenbacteria bacterium]MBU1949540.1 response regulator transcription factor [Candidatus Eisenbacteria bacterium]MBU2691931.1 response regulator transcription factor [Candidatus Eisenbacteria bacterium]